ncbi:hypothetical protein BKP35_10575 [Anaerobacillus arseniciselenatis]|uniref:Uncharacterized protein n=1 Tax=Anaerobacillus arseniciselenatis TaxID=85682 RepID=A0A1S2LKN5_9BACI|nr:hypothetical protein [Anaerobacillus arseniciselenatis]OIJ12623.1 hypothetical protein BKP35_10575 [Anaerobacillus arseniciselenatis]
MKSGNIQQYAHFSEFDNVQQFNETIKHFLHKNSTQFTKSELVAFYTLTRFSVKKIGVCNARICKLVEATQSSQGGVSRSTFERMLRKAKKLGIITVHHTTREKGGISHNVYVFHKIDGANHKKLTDRHKPQKQEPSTVPIIKKAEETIKIENKNIKEKHLRPINIESLDHTYVPSYVPEPFIKAVRPFFDRAKQICELWDRVLIAYRSMKFTAPVEHFLPTIIQAFKETVYKYKQGKVKTGFVPYFYGTLSGMLVAEKRRRIVASERTEWCGWLEA